MALVFSEMDRAKIFERSVSSFKAEVKPHFILRLIEQPRPSYAHFDFEKLWLHFPQVMDIFQCQGL